MMLIAQLRRAASARCIWAIPREGFSSATPSSPNSSSGAQKTNLEEAAEAAGLIIKPSVSDELLGRLKDKGLLHTAGYIGGKWTSGSKKGASFQVGTTGMCITTCIRKH